MLTDVRETEKFARENGMQAMLDSAVLRANRYSKSIAETEKLVAELNQAIKAIEDRQMDIEDKTGKPSKR